MIGHIVFLLSTINLIAVSSVPSYIRICHRNDPNVNDCIRKSVEELRPHFPDGIPELDVPPMEPLRLPDYDVDRFDNFTINLKLKNVDLFGATNFKINDLQWDVENFIFKFIVTFPIIRFTGKYAINTEVLRMHLQGEADFDANATDCQCDGLLKAEGTHGKLVHYAKFDMKLNIGDYWIRTGNIIQNNPELSAVFNEVINTNRKEMIHFVTPLIEQKASETFLDLANRVVKNFAYDELFPD